MSRVERLLQTRPSWVCVTRAGGHDITLTAAPPRAGNIPSRSYQLTIAWRADQITVQETKAAVLLPNSCPERHINGDGTFCLGWQADHLPATVEATKAWWGKLQVFLTYQETAHETGHWPEYAQLSHGDAAQFQLAAENLAHELGLEDLYQQALAGAENIITNLARRIDPKTMRLRNGRALCACGRTGRRGRRILRRDCWKLGLKCLPVLERQRSDELRRFWAIRAGTPCCGTMRGCPLRRAG
jgi:hypothetical protein